MISRNDYVLILGSGGIDSTACIKYYLNLKFQVEVLFVDYGQRSIVNEKQSVQKICDFFNVNLFQVKITQPNEPIAGEILGRNALLYFIGIMYFTKSYGIIASGIHHGTNYYDCSLEFINSIENIFENYGKGKIKVGAPFLAMNKMEVFNYCIMENIPIDLTYSCELGEKQPCGKCLTCKDLEAIYASKK